MPNEFRTSIVLLPALVAVLAFSGCASITGTETSYKPWVGDDVYQGKGGAVEVVNGVEIWEHGEPNKPYKVIGLITQSKSDDSVNQLLFGKYSQQQITDIVTKEGGDGVVVMSSKQFVSGYTTQMPMNQFDVARTSPDYSTASVLAVFRYVSPAGGSNETPRTAP